MAALSMAALSMAVLGQDLPTSPVFQKPDPRCAATAASVTYFFLKLWAILSLYAGP
jgi:hypothetical protein